jgi:Rhodanese-like domain
MMLEVPLHLAGHQQAAGLIPPGSTAFHLLLAVPIPAGLSGATAALSPKCPGRHPSPGNLLRPVAVRDGRLRGLAGRPVLAAGRRPAGPGRPVLAAATWACRCSRSASSTPTNPDRRPPCPSSTSQGANLEPQPGDSSTGRPRGPAAADPAIRSTAAAQRAGCCPTDLLGRPAATPTKHAQAGGRQVNLDLEVVAYCRIGERSAHTWFVLHELLGYPRVRNDDGSWTEWGSLVGAPSSADRRGLA